MSDQTGIGRDKGRTQFSGSAAGLPMPNRRVRPGDVIAQCLIAAKGQFVSIATIRDFLIARNKVNATRKINDYIGDIKRYNFGVVEKSGDNVRLVNWEAFDANGHNRSLPPGLTVAQRNLGGIYTITNSQNDAMYVGKAMNFGRRWANHKNALGKGTEHHSRSLQDDWNAFGRDAFHFKILLVCDLELLDLFERRAISVLKPAYNTTGTRDAQIHAAAGYQGVAHAPETMNGADSLDTIAAMLRSVQAQQRVMQDEIALIRRDIADIVRSDEGAELLRVLADRIDAFATVMENRFALLFAALGTGRSDQPRQVGT